MADSVNRYDTYPWFKIWPRWFFGLIEIGISVYLLITFKMYLGLAYTAYWIVSLFVLLPLIRCVHCYYYGKRCNTAWGLFAGFAFPKGETKYFQSGYALTFILWPLRILPIGLGLLGLIDGFSFVPDGLFGIYIVVILLHRLYYRSANCRVCYMQSECPVYNPHVLRARAEIQESPE
jgi:hypothetical protein